MWSAFHCNPCSSPVFLPLLPLQPKPNQAVAETRAAILVLPTTRLPDSQRRGKHVHLALVNILYAVIYCT